MTYKLDLVQRELKSTVAILSGAFEARVHIRVIARLPWQLWLLLKLIMLLMGQLYHHLIILLYHRLGVHVNTLCAV